jgi:hypothetical protein
MPRHRWTAALLGAAGALVGAGAIAAASHGGPALRLTNSPVPSTQTTTTSTSTGTTQSSTASSTTSSTSSTSSTTSSSTSTTSAPPKAPASPASPDEQKEQGGSEKETPEAADSETKDAAGEQAGGGHSDTAPDASHDFQGEE